MHYDAKTGHSSVSEILRMAQKYSITNTGLIHVNPNWSKEDEESASYLLKEFTNVKILNDGDVIIF